MNEQSITKIGDSQGSSFAAALSSPIKGTADSSSPWLSVEASPLALTFTLQAMLKKELTETLQRLAKTRAEMGKIQGQAADKGAEAIKSSAAHEADALNKQGITQAAGGGLTVGAVGIGGAHANTIDAGKMDKLKTQETNLKPYLTARDGVDTARQVNNGAGPAIAGAPNPEVLAARYDTLNPTARLNGPDGQPVPAPEPTAIRDELQHLHGSDRAAYSRFDAKLNNEKSEVQKGMESIEQKRSQRIGMYNALGQAGGGLLSGAGSATASNDKAAAGSDSAEDAVLRATNQMADSAGNVLGSTSQATSGAIDSQSEVQRNLIQSNA